MKVKTISRTQESYARSSKDDVHMIHKNTAVELHPFEREREYIRTLNATKLGRLFAKPFIGSLETPDAVYSLAKSLSHISTLYSGCANGSVQLWNLNNMKLASSFDAHDGMVKGMTLYENTLVTCGDKTLKFWDSSNTLLQTYLSKQTLNYVDHHYSQPLFATASSTIELWDHSRATPLYSMHWGAESITSVKFNQTETSVLASCGTDRTVILYDIRTKSPLSKVILAMRTNAIAWNPMEAFNFTIANEDHNCYTFDMRNLSNCLSVAKDHVSAVMDIDYSPTGQEFVTASYDHTIRIFNAREGKSRDMYHGKRMQKVFGVKVSMDAKFIMSASDDGNVRVWKMNAAEKLGILSNREKDANDYNAALKNRYKNLPEIRRIERQRRTPKAIKSASNKKHVMVQSRKRKQDSRRAHSTPGSIPFVAERKKNILTVEK